MTSKAISENFNEDDIPSAHPTDIIYWRALVAGGRAREWACTRLFTKYADIIEKKLRARQVPEVEIQELIQEIFIKVIKNCETYCNSEKKFVDWFFAIVQNTATDHLRKNEVDQKREKQIKAHIDEMAIVVPYQLSTHTHTLALQDCVQSSFREFEKKYPDRAQVIKLAVFENLGHKELARILDKDHRNTREYLSQCKKKFKSFVDHCKIYLNEDVL